MERLITFSTIFIMIYVIQSLPIENGFTIRFNPSASRDEFKTKKIGRIFAKVPEDPENRLLDTKRDIFTNTFSHTSDTPSSPTQVTNVPTAVKDTLEFNESEAWPTNNMNFLNLPVLSQPYADYKVLVAAAPPNLVFGSDKKKLIVYVVFSDDGSGETNLEEIPKIYFVNEKKLKNKVKKEEDEPILIIDSNRTVTGLKSKEIAKFLKFRNKLTNRFNYNVTR